ncbi:MAG: tRNA 2-thiouridine(34) synthase MnmA [Candidatus Sungbacteria bacterium]|uniref:tRNA-specific 2-thiouridylase MnmA n=1 Tax=Candidatus Sungiibacteriota bacterium TaxID=2750080 RepID=A0A9D6LRY4_9BACT|nr:tRNA 2-thiouridine(34) synthase MnmA [Candidatus Sungbacteria bacterium]
MLVRNKRKARHEQCRRVIVGMSGGVDSSVAALLLKNEGYDVSGVYMKNWPPAPDSVKSLGAIGSRESAESPAARAGKNPKTGAGIGAGQAVPPYYSCSWKEDRRDAMRVAAMLDIPFETWDFTKEYREAVVAYMLREYAAGRTPNPDVMCNREIKFGVFLKKALGRGADFVATGHYVRKSQQPTASSQEYELREAKDKNKDQSYFLWTLTQDQISHSLFPIGHYLKSEVREIARKNGLPTAERPDSQGICFIGEIDVTQFLKDHIPARHGKVLTSSGKIVGEHDGVQFYTIGQRHGLGFGGGIPYYVASKDLKTNTLVVAEGPHDNNLFSKTLNVSDPHWIYGRPPAGGFPFACEARIRYRQSLQKCRIMNPRTRTSSVRGRHELGIRVSFDDEQRAITPGQSIVFYGSTHRSPQVKAMLGGGIIQADA